MKTDDLLPGVGDGLKTVRGMALPFAFLYRSLAEHFAVYVFSRRRILSPGMYKGLGHGLYEEAPDFLKRVSDFCI